MEKKLGGIVELSLAVLIVILVLYFSSDIKLLASYGYAGLFIIAMLSTATIIFPSPGWAAIIGMSAYLDPILLGIVAGIGAGIGEMTGFLAGDGARTLINNRFKETKKAEGWIKKYGAFGIFVLSAIPNPLFDIAGIVAGGLKMAWWKFLPACILGRILRYVLIALLGAFTIHFFF